MQNVTMVVLDDNFDQVFFVPESVMTWCNQNNDIQLMDGKVSMTQEVLDDVVNFTGKEIDNNFPCKIVSFEEHIMVYLMQFSTLFKSINIAQEFADKNHMNVVGDFFIGEYTV